jgi:hypothetical protein
MLQLPGMKHHSLCSRSGTVTPVPNDRMSDRCGMDSNLVGPPSFDDDLSQRRAVPALRTKRSPRAPALHRRLDDSLLVQLSLENGQVRLSDLTRGE